jgi:S1-C subfamily serine protease
MAQGGPYTSVQQVEAWVELMPDECYMVRCDEMGLNPTASAQLSIRSNGTEIVALPSGTVTAPARAGFVTGMVLNADGVGRSTLSISPNPAADAVRVSSAGFGSRWSIMDGQGRLVMEAAAASTGEDAVIDVSGLKPGLYILELDGVSASRSRLVIQR